MSDIDIVERLRATASNDPHSTYARPMREAADEIEGLRAALREIADLDANPYEQAHVEIAREALNEQ